MTAVLAKVPDLVADFYEDWAWDIHNQLAELGVDTPDDPCPDCQALTPCPFECGLCTERTCSTHQHEDGRHG